MTPIHILEVKNVLGEGVVWDVRTQTALWTDIQSSRFWQWQPGGELTSFALPQRFFTALFKGFDRLSDLIIYLLYISSDLEF